MKGCFFYSTFFTFILDLNDSEDPDYAVTVGDETTDSGTSDPPSDGPEDVLQILQKELDKDSEVL